MINFRVFIAICLLASPVHAQSDEEVAAARLVYIDGDYRQSLAVLRPAAEAGNPVAQNIMGNAYDNGNGVEVDMAQAIRWYELAAEQDFDKAIYNLGLIYSNDGNGVARDYERAIAYYDRAIAMDYDHAMNNRARMYELGQGSEVDLTAAADLFQQAADLGNALAMNNLGRFYINGTGVNEDFGYALTLFKTAASMGEPRAISNLGAMYGNGYGVGQDDIAAMALYKMAAEQGNAQAASNLAYDLIEGAAGLRNPEQGWGWCLSALARAEPGEDFTEDCDYLGSLLTDAEKATGAEFAATLNR